MKVQDLHDEEQNKRTIDIGNRSGGTKLIDMTCPHCGAALHIDKDLEYAYCQYCGTKFLVKDETVHIKYDNSEQAGYEYESGKLRAQEEYRQRRIAEQQEQQRIIHERMVQAQNDKIKEQNNAADKHRRNQIAAVCAGIFGGLVLALISTGWGMLGGLTGILAGHDFKFRHRNKDYRDLMYAFGISALAFSVIYVLKIG